MSLAATLQNQAFASVASYSGPFPDVVQVANGVALAGQMLDVTAVFFSLFLMASLRVAARPRRFWALVPFLFAFTGGVCFIFSFLMLSWVMQPFEVFVAVTATTVACILPGVAYATVYIVSVSG